MSNTRPEVQMSFQTGDWYVLRQWLHEQEASMKDRLCDSSLSPEDTNVLRGRITMIKEILKLEKLATQNRVAN